MAAAGDDKSPPTTTTTFETSVSSSQQSSYDRFQDLKAFDDTHAGVKGLVDAGVTKIPRIFIRPPEDFSGGESAPDSRTSVVSIPVIDLGSCAAIDEVRKAAGTFGFFQVVNHGIPVGVLEAMLRGVRAFHEQTQEAKRVYYSRDMNKKVAFRVAFLSNFDLYASRFANWRDTFRGFFGPDPFDPLLLPEICRDIVLEYAERVKKLGHALLQILSEALGLGPQHLVDMDCGKGRYLAGHYYPGCPEPDLTMGATEHSDTSFFTVLLQDQSGGLQVSHQNKWVNVLPIPGALVINIGDLLQLVSNDKFQSAEHRVLAKRTGPRVSVACFFNPAFDAPEKVYAPIKVLLLSEESETPPLYRETTVKEFRAHYKIRGLDGKRILANFRIAQKQDQRSNGISSGVMSEEGEIR